MSNDIHQVEVSIEEARKVIKKAEALRKLIAMPEWDEIIDTGYFVKEASRNVILKAHPNLQGDVEQAAISKNIDAIGTFRQYLSTIEILAQTAEGSLPDDEDTLAKLLKEDV